MPAKAKGDGGQASKRRNAKGEKKPQKRQTPKNNDALRLPPTQHPPPIKNLHRLNQRPPRPPKKHNEGGSPHTSKYKPWHLVTYLAFSTRQKATTFETYLKSGSGRAFAAKRLW